MSKISKRMALIAGILIPGKAYSIQEAVDILKRVSTIKFKESLDISINLGVDPKKSDQVVRGATVLPYGTGKIVRVAVFAEGVQAEAAKEAGADIVGFQDLLESVKAGNINFDVVIATPDAMRIVGQLGPILGPRGLMPNPKVGTVASDAGLAVKNAKSGQVRYRTDKAGIIHCAIGNIEFDSESIKLNLEALVSDLKKAKPSSSKGIYVKNISISSTMGPGILIDKTSLDI